MQLVRQPHKEARLSVWDDGDWEWVSIPVTLHLDKWDDRAIMWTCLNTNAVTGQTFSEADIDKAYRDEECKEWKELVAKLSEQGLVELRAAVPKGTIGC